MQRDELLDHGEADSRAGDGALVLALEPVVAREDAAPLSRRDARPVVFDGDARATAVARDADDALIPFGAVLHGVVEKIEHDLPDRSVVDVRGDLVARVQSDG